MPTKRSAILVFGTMADTTWRMFVPSVGATLLGVWADKSFGTLPWFSVLGIILGSVAAIKLVLLQLKSIDRNNPQ